MKYPIYEQCVNSVKNALEVLEALHHRESITDSAVQAIRLRRRTADIAMLGTFDELRHAFITPIDREDLLRMRQMCETIVYDTEEILIQLYRQNRSALPYGDNKLLLSAIRECQLLQASLERFSDFPRSDDVVCHLTDLIRQHRKSEEQFSTDQGVSTLKNVSAACFSAAETLLQILLKVE